MHFPYYAMFSISFALNAKTKVEISPKSLLLENDNLQSFLVKHLILVEAGILYRLGAPWYSVF